MNNYQDYNSRFSNGPAPSFGNRTFNRGAHSYHGRGMGNGGYGQHYNGRGNSNSFSNQSIENQGPQQYVKPMNSYDNRRNHFENRGMQGKPFFGDTERRNNYEQRGRSNHFGNRGMPGRNNYGGSGLGGQGLQYQQKDQSYGSQNQAWDMPRNGYQQTEGRSPLLSAPRVLQQENGAPFENKSRFEGNRIPGNKLPQGESFGTPPPQRVPEMQQHSTLSEWGNQDDLNQFIQANQVTFKGENIPKPIMSFSAIALPEFIRTAIVRENYVTPTPIQSLTWPIAIGGKNMVGIAQTGSGKTLGFVLPGILQVLRLRDQGQPRKPICSPSILVLAPTRELAQQTQEVASKFGGREIRSLCVYGGASRKLQQNRLDSRLDMVIATPGRLNDFLMAGEIDLQNCRYLVLDEADRMLDMGFEPQVRRIIKHVGSDSQTLMFSATWPRDVKQLAEEFLGDYAQVSIGSISASPVANHSINQIVEICQEADKMERLFKVINDVTYEKENKMLIFAATKKKVNQLEREIRGANFPVVAIHGSKPQGERDNALRGFSTGRFQLMVATDVASRGLDVNDIKYVINFDFPTSAEDYIHRIGRTGRCGKSGTSFTFMTSKNASHAKELVNVLREANQPVPRDLENMARYSKGGPADFRSRGLKKGFKRERGFNFDNPAASWQEKKFKWERKPVY